MYTLTTFPGGGRGDFQGHNLEGIRFHGTTCSESRDWTQIVRSVHKLKILVGGWEDTAVIEDKPLNVSPLLISKPPTSLEKLTLLLSPHFPFLESSFRFLGTLLRFQTVKIVYLYIYPYIIALWFGLTWNAKEFPWDYLKNIYQNVYNLYKQFISVVSIWMSNFREVFSVCTKHYGVTH